MNKKKIRLKRAKRARIKIKNFKKKRLSINLTTKNIYAQIIFFDKILISVSTLEKKIKNKLINKNNKYAASLIGKILAKKCIKKNIKKISFDKSGYKYHGKIKALAESAREYGLIF